MKWSRRAVLAGGAGLLWQASRGEALLQGAARSVLADDLLRPQYHLMPPGAWMNDPNGPIYWRGRYHLFYQVNPTGGADWGDISWAHAVSTDMVHWRNLPDVMEPHTGSVVGAQADAPDSYGVFSGSAIADGERTLFFYTAVERSTKADATLHGDKELREQQCVAVATDNDLRRFVRQRKPLIERPPADMQPTAGFRDPSVWRDGKTWYMILGSGVIDREGAVLLYRASVPTGDKADWTYLHPLLTGAGNGRHTDDTVDAGTMWECPDFFELDGRHVLLYSTERKVFWMTGRLDRAAMKFVPEQRGLLDSGAYYAPKSMLGPRGERILWGWIPEKRPKEEYILSGWSGAMALPRVLGVDTAGRLTMRVAPVVDRLAGAKHACAPEARVPGTAGKLSLQLKPGGTCVVRLGEAEVLRVARKADGAGYDVNGTELAAIGGGGLTAYVDASVIEVFAGEDAACTVRAYPKLKRGASLEVTVSGAGSTGTLQPLRAISDNRMTTPVAA